MVNSEYEIISKKDIDKLSNEVFDFIGFIEKSDEGLLDKLKFNEACLCKFENHTCDEILKNKVYGDFPICSIPDWAEVEYWDEKSEVSYYYEKAMFERMKKYNEGIFTYRLIPKEFIDCFMKCNTMKEDVYRDKINFKNVLFIDKETEDNDLSDEAKILINKYIPNRLIILK